MDAVVKSLRPPPIHYARREGISAARSILFFGKFREVSSASPGEKRRLRPCPVASRGVQARMLVLPTKSGRSKPVKRFRRKGGASHEWTQASSQQQIVSRRSLQAGDGAKLFGAGGGSRAGHRAQHAVELADREREAHAGQPGAG